MLKISPNISSKVTSLPPPVYTYSGMDAPLHKIIVHKFKQNFFLAFLLNLLTLLVLFLTAFIGTVYRLVKSIADLLKVILIIIVAIVAFCGIYYVLSLPNYIDNLISNSGLLRNSTNESFKLY